MRYRFIVLGMIVALPLSAQDYPTEADVDFPQRMTSDDLAVACASSAITGTGRERRKYCYGFVSGVEEVLRLQGTADGPEAGPCVPLGTSAREMASAYMRYASRRDFDRRKPAALAVIKALRTEYPCPGAAPDR